MPRMFAPVLKGLRKVHLSGV